MVHLFLDMYDGILSIYIYACGLNLVTRVMMLPKFYHINIEMLMQYNAKQMYIHKVLKKVGVYLQGQNCLL